MTNNESVRFPSVSGQATSLGVLQWRQMCVFVWDWLCLAPWAPDSPTGLKALRLANREQTASYYSSAVIPALPRKSLRSRFIAKEHEKGQMWRACVYFISSYVNSQISISYQRWHPLIFGKYNSNKSKLLQKQTDAWWQFLQSFGFTLKSLSGVKRCLIKPYYQLNQTYFRLIFRIFSFIKVV